MDVHVILSLKERLTKLEYPNINTLNDQQIADIFSKGNRIRLLIWYIEKLYTNIVLPTSMKDLETFVADIIHENGFCTSSQKNKFVGSALDVSSQLKIISKMLNYLLVIQSHEENPAPLNDVKTDIDELDAFVKQDINLFPMYGPMKVRTLAERKKKIEECKRESQLLKHQIESLQQEEDINLEYDVNEKGIDVNTINCLQKNIEQFTDDSNSLLACKVGHTKEDNKFGDGFADITSNCKAQLSSVAKSFECMKVISNFSPVCSVRSTEENEFVDAIKDLSELSNELFS